MICVQRLNFSVGTFALQDVSLEVRAGEYFVLLGPSGAGKTLLLECLCGLNRIDSGRVVIGGSDVTRLQPRSRRVGYLPQDYALFPHLTVRKNIAFGLANRGRPDGSTRRQVDDLLDLLGLAPLAERRPGNLSGGEKQRVALARALAIRPHVLLLDEPVSALDEQTCDAVCRQLKHLQRTTQTTTIHVCHNFAEMLAVADRAGIIYDGRILQVGTPREILQHPRSSLVARFVQARNLFAARARGEGDWLRLTSPGGIALCARRADGQTAERDVVIMVRPENIRLRAAPPSDPPPGTMLLRGTVRHVVDAGPVVHVTVACGTGDELLVSLGRREYNDTALAAGQTVCVSVSADDVHVMDE
jgi:molybdate/tungstate transport system ATP-binding protein